MPIVYACIAPHGGHLMIPPGMPSPVAKCRAALDAMALNLARSRPDVIVVLTPHGIYLENKITVGFVETGYGELDSLTVSADMDLEMAAAWTQECAERGIPLAPVSIRDESAPFPLDWGVTIPLALLAPEISLPIVVACPGREVSRENLVALGSALLAASDNMEKRVALIVSADQGHGHAVDGPYGFTPESAEYDAAMIAAIDEDDIERLLTWDEEWAEMALADSYWQTLSLIGIRRHVPLPGIFHAYQVDNYFGLLCAEFFPEPK